MTSPERGTTDAVDPESIGLSVDGVADGMVIGSPGSPTTADEYVTSIKAVVRVRPYRGSSTTPCIEHVPSDGPESILHVVPNPNSRHRARTDDATYRNYDAVFWSTDPPPLPFTRPATNHDLFERIGVPVLEKAFRGMNSTVFAYGQTGSGKSYTMGLGEDIPDGDPGLIPAIVKELFARIDAAAAGGADGSPARGVGGGGGGVCAGVRGRSVTTEGEAELTAGLHREWEVRISFMEVFNDHHNGGTVRDLCPYSPFTQDDAKKVRSLYAKALAVVEGKGKPRGGGGVPYDGVEEILRQVFKNASADEIRTRALLLYDYRRVEAPLSQRQIDVALPPSLHGGIIAGVHGREAGVLATKRDELCEEGGHYYPKGLAERKCSSWADVEALLAKGTARRRSQATDFNEHSSRSHAIVQLRVDTFLVTDREERVRDTTALINLVDLAGSERYKKAGTLGGGRQGETQGINTSLEYLGRVLKGMAKGGRTGDVVGSLRMVCLTRLLASSIGGNSETWMVACVHPSISEWDETSSTLAYAQVAREIKQVVRQNRIGMGSMEEVINRITAELARVVGEESERAAELQAERQRLQSVKDQMEADQAREREQLEYERLRREDAERAREEQRAAFEASLSKLDAEAAQQHAQLEAMEKALDGVHAEQEAASSALTAQEAAYNAHKAAQKREFERQVEEIEKAQADEREKERRMAALIEEAQVAKRASEEELERASIHVEVTQRREAVLREQIEALKEGNEARVKRLERVRAHIDEAAEGTDQARQRAQLLEADLAVKKERLEELRDASRVRERALDREVEDLEDADAKVAVECRELLDAIAAREYDTRQASSECAAKQGAIADRKAKLKKRLAQLEVLKREEVQMDEELDEVDDQLAKLYEAQLDLTRMLEGVEVD